MFRKGQKQNLDQQLPLRLDGTMSASVPVTDVKESTVLPSVK
jgi:hypothetical protein